ncbi:MAG: ABC transporter ATP-binding protein [Kofleriaceae bacterium]|nr:MAG: ABC transporter ATP-binding protein [Kofleriaceae bacterium]MBZ0236908.1 ABC transporter ATP-binding protein [Kofleriaceae bacterium]
MPEPAPVLVVEGVVKEYGDRVKTRALDGVDLVLEAGELTALMGPSGCGKSTLLNIVGLLDRATAGRVVVAGQDTTGLDERALTTLRAHALGFVFQFHHLLPAFTALENVMLPAWGDRGMPTREMRADGEEMLRAVGLADRMHYRANHLSGGQQQRVAIARALVRKPRLVLADEPTGNLDTASSEEVFALMRRFNRELGITFLVVTHDPRIAAHCDRVVEMVDGRIRNGNGEPFGSPRLVEISGIEPLTS